MTVEVRDAIHGLISLPPTAWKVIDTRPFQRLRRVQQLALTHLVYPGARHSRLEHSVGAAHIAARLADAINGRPGVANKVPVERVQLAALVHDIGHGPFSHVSEEVMEALTGRSKIHEAISAAIVRHDQEVTAALGAADAGWIADLLEGTGHGKNRSVERDIVAGPADIDKLDYLLRDSHYCGVEYGRYDLDKVIESARCLADATGTALAFDVGALYALEEMLLARYHMHRQVYGHRTRVATDRMLVRAITLGVESGQLPKEVFAPPQDMTAEFVAEYLKWDDAAVVHELLQDGSSNAGQVMQALIDRRLFKLVARYGQPELEALEKNVQQRGFIAQPDDDAMTRLLPDVEAAIAAAAGVDPHWVCLHWENRKDPLASQLAVRVAASTIILVEGDGKGQWMFEKRSEVFREGVQPPEVFISLYLRPPDDRKLDSKVLKQVTRALKDGLKTIGAAAKAV